MNRDQFQKWIDEHGTGQRENKSCNGIDWVLVTMKDTWIALGVSQSLCKPSN